MGLVLVIGLFFVVLDIFLLVLLLILLLNPIATPKEILVHWYKTYKRRK